MYKKARIVRMDMDTTSKKGMHAKIIEDFENHKYDILLGTQMIAKGLDFPLVTLVGVINADTSLNVPDFRSAERTFELLCQVSGRAGRSNLKGEVIIQTYNDSHYSIVLSKTHNYLNFYKEEMRLRKQLKYPPYYYLTLVKISTKDYDYGFKEANKIGDYLREKLDANYTVLGPTMANVFKVNNVYSFQCIIKYRNDTLLKRVLLDIDTQYKLNTKIKVEIDVNPIKL
jgi:primosomal protein N' (replication factor Y)